MLNFREIKQAISIQQVCDWLAIELHREGSSFRAKCPTCDGDNPRALVVNTSKQIWNLFCNRCPKGGGDIFSLVANVKNVPIKEAAKLLNDHFHATTPENKPVPTPDDELKPLDHLIADHQLCTELGFSKEICERIGAGYAKKGILSGRLLIPIRLPSGKLIGYIGVSPKLDPIIKLPTRWR